MSAALSACGQASERATDQSNVKADDTFVQAFMGHCVHTFPDTAKIEAAAKATRMKPITDPATLRMIGPASGNADWKAWGFKADKKGFMLATGQNISDGERVRFCVLISEPADLEATRSRLVELLKAERQDESEEGGQRYEIYKFEFDGRPMLLNFIDGTPMGMKMLNASTMIAPGI